MEENKNYVLGIIGALIGGLIASLPWIICYVYLNMLWSLLALPIAIGALKGYQLLKGKENKKLPIIISVVSFVVITVVTLVIIPLLLLAKENYAATIDNLRLLYKSSEFTAAIIKDYIFSLFFTILGISGAISSIKNQLDNNVSNIKITNASSIGVNNGANKEQISKIKEVFVKNDALSKTNAIDKQVILDEVNDNITFNTLKMQQIIKKYKGKYYFSEKAEKSFLYRFGILYAKIMLIIILITFVIILLAI